MVKDLVTGEDWIPSTDFVRAMYNMGRYVDDTKAEFVEETTTQGEREAEFNRWLAAVRAEVPFDADGYRWSVAARNGSVFLQRSKEDALALAYATGMGVVKEHRNGDRGYVGIFDNEPD